MLTARPTEGKLRVATNLVPMADGSVCVRPGARQVVAGAVSEVVPWGNRLLLHQAGRMVLWDGALHDLGPSGPVLAAAPFQALTDLGEREDRLYLADGVRSLRYVAVRAGQYGVYAVENSCLDPVTSEPLAVPVPIAVANWQGRLWVSTGGNFVQHCENDAPDYWNPLWTIDCQGGDRSRVLALRPADDALLVGLSGSLWAITGKSQYDFQRAAVGNGGVAGTHCLAADGAASWWMGPLGVWTAGAEQPLSAPVQEWFYEGVTGSLVVDRPRRRVLACVNGRALACDLASGAWTELVPFNVYGVWASEARAGWYGPDGVWALGAESEPWTLAAGVVPLDDAGSVDLALDGGAVDVAAQAEPWPQIPNPAGRGRAELKRSHFHFLVSAQANAQLEFFGDDRLQGVFLWPMSVPGPTWESLGEDPALVADWRPILKEAVPRVQGTVFYWRLSLAGRARLVRFTLQYQGVRSG